MTLKDLFTGHPASVNETYLEHMRMSGSFALALTLAAGAAFIHAVFPFLFKKTASGIISGLYGAMVTGRVVRPVPSKITAG